MNPTLKAQKNKLERKWIGKEGRIVSGGMTVKVTVKAVRYMGYFQALVEPLGTNVSVWKKLDNIEMI